MKNKLFIITSIIIILSTGMTGCHQPDELLPPVSRNGINSLTVTFPDGSGNFTVTVEEGMTEIVIPIPYFYPEDSDNQITEDMIKKMKVKANLDDNVIVEPALTFIDLSQTTTITVIDQRKERKQYTVRGEIQKSKNALIENFSLPEYGLSGIINHNEGTISLVTIEDLSEPVLAELTLSYHASISPDPRTEALEYELGQELVVTAHDGVTKKLYTVLKAVPEKIPFGMRPESAKLMFAKKLNADLGIADGLTTGIALSGNHLVINSRGNNSVYIDAKTGDKVGEIDLGSLKGANKNYYHTSDEDGNILISNLIPNDGSTFRISKLSSVNSTPEPFITWAPESGVALGRKFSVNGSILSDAIITAPLNPSGWNTQFARWQVTGGSLVSQEPEIITVTIPVGGHLSNPYTSPQPGRGWTTNVDIISSSSTVPNADYFMAYYGDNLVSWVNGNTNTQGTFIHYNRTDFIGNSVDYIEFNNAKYLTVNFVNGMSGGTGDIVWILDATNDSKFNQGNLNASTSPAIVWEGPRRVYGALGIDAPINNVYGADVLFKPSDDGYFLYLYFVFNNGSVVGYQFDCVKM